MSTEKLKAEKKDLRLKSKIVEVFSTPQQQQNAKGEMETLLRLSPWREVLQPLLQATAESIKDEIMSMDNADGDNGLRFLQLNAEYRMAVYLADLPKNILLSFTTAKAETTPVNLLDPYNHTTTTQEESQDGR